MRQQLHFIVSSFIHQRCFYKDSSYIHFHIRSSGYGKLFGSC